MPSYHGVRVRVRAPSAAGRAYARSRWPLRLYGGGGGGGGDGHLLIMDTLTHSIARYSDKSANESGGGHDQHKAAGMLLGFSLI